MPITAFFLNHETKRLTQVPYEFYVTQIVKALDNIKNKISVEENLYNVILLCSIVIKQYKPKTSIMDTSTTLKDFESLKKRYSNNDPDPFIECSRLQTFLLEAVFKDPKISWSTYQRLIVLNDPNVINQLESYLFSILIPDANNAPRLTEWMFYLCKWSQEASESLIKRIKFIIAHTDKLICVYNKRPFTKNFNAFSVLNELEEKQHFKHALCYKYMCEPLMSIINNSNEGLENNNINAIQKLIKKKRAWVSLLKECDEKTNPFVLTYLCEEYGDIVDIAAKSYSNIHSLKSQKFESQAEKVKLLKINAFIYATPLFINDELADPNFSSEPYTEMTTLDITTSQGKKKININDFNQILFGPHKQTLNLNAENNDIYRELAVNYTAEYLLSGKRPNGDNQLAESFNRLDMN